MDKEDSCRDKKDSVKSSLPLHHIVAKPQSCIGEQCAPALCRGFFMYTGVHECTRHFRHKNAPNCENSGRFVYIFVYAFRKPLTLNVYCGETGTRTDYSYQLSKNLFNSRVRAMIGGKFSTDADPTENLKENLIDDVALEYQLTKRDNMFLKLFRHTGYESILEGEVTETGVGFVIRKRVLKISDLFRVVRERVRKNEAENQNGER